MRKKRFIFTAAVVVALGVSGCGGSGTTNGKASCTLHGSGGTVTLEKNADGLTAKFSKLPVPSSGTALYSVTAYDAAGEHGGQLGIKYLDGKQIAFFVFDFGSGKQTNLNGAPSVSGDTITVTAPDSDLGPLSGIDIAQWSGSYNVNGDDVGQCPGGIGYLPFPSRAAD